MGYFDIEHSDIVVVDLSSAICTTFCNSALHHSDNVLSEFSVCRVSAVSVIGEQTFVIYSECMFDGIWFMPYFEPIRLLREVLMQISLNSPCIVKDLSYSEGIAII
jgi:hypothetical protein